MVQSVGVLLSNVADQDNGVKLPGLNICSMVQACRTLPFRASYETPDGSFKKASPRCIRGTIDTLIVDSVARESQPHLDLVRTLQRLSSLQFTRPRLHSRLGPEYHQEPGT